MSRRGAAKPYTSVQGHHESSIVIVTIETQRRQSALDGSLGYTPGCLEAAVLQKPSNPCP